MAEGGFGESIHQDTRSRGGFNPTLTVLLVVVGVVLLFVIGNYALYIYAQKTLPGRKKKPVSKKKMKRERLKQGMAPVGD
ncbi:DNA-binding protein S1FA-like [Selaginella moellendorffii]|uniref:DNA-binding protein S1FA-like n=1 Tax=Selaginella moellendorffii TaxID=88036 RepID=UPI000D1CE7A6|nr:DNA-binding protein S1FA-like [Selaginella moellendorffii]|eukprot:XP_024533408.1 DNA-binding protein S1FA-like [Selaginella moellendorffii]